MDALAGSDFHAVMPQTAVGPTDVSLNADGAFSSLLALRAQEGAAASEPAARGDNTAERLLPRPAEVFRAKAGKTDVAATHAPPVIAAPHPDSPALRFAALAGPWLIDGAEASPDLPAQADLSANGVSAPALAEHEGNSDFPDARSGAAAPEMLAGLPQHWASTPPYGARDGQPPAVPPANPFAAAESASDRAPAPSGTEVALASAFHDRAVAPDTPANPGAPLGQVVDPVARNANAPSSTELAAPTGEPGPLAVAPRNLPPDATAPSLTHKRPDGMPKPSPSEGPLRFASTDQIIATTPPRAAIAPGNEQGAGAPPPTGNHTGWQLHSASALWQQHSDTAGDTHTPTKAGVPPDLPLTETNAEVPLRRARFAPGEAPPQTGNAPLRVRVSNGAVAPGPQHPEHPARPAQPTGASAPTGQPLSDPAARDHAPVAARTLTESAAPLVATPTRPDADQPARKSSATAPSPSISAAVLASDPATDPPHSTSLRPRAAQADAAIGAAPVASATPDPELFPTGFDDAPPIQAAHSFASDRGTTAPLAQPGHSAETAASVLRQLSEVVMRLPDRPVELTLAPEELGRVRLTLATTEHGVSVSVLAERSETLELIRRNIDHLARDFRELGYSSIAFSFGDRSQQGHPDPQAQVSDAEAEVIVTAAPAAPGRAQTPQWSTAPTAGGLDLRL
ncbi:MAG: hypothetical protein CVT82_09240 [Alphaproteobacteria bacterium HGW-Alphaproteobacteria-4]|nr:MAG: hypothetical protein CVT82_09240 [Alphaproteobacteria bacterium HGW-Alphaproteobacteria-4]